MPWSRPRTSWSASTEAIPVMVRENEIRPSEVAVDPPPATDAGLVFIGIIRTPWTSRMVTPRQGRLDGPVCRIEIFDPWQEALAGVEAFERLEVLYWLHRSRRDLVRQSPANDGRAAHLPCAHRSGQIRSARRSQHLSASRDRPCWYAAWIASTAPHCWTSSPIGHCSSQSRRRNKAISRPGRQSKREAHTAIGALIVASAT
jgi:hypothetical protein